MRNDAFTTALANERIRTGRLLSSVRFVDVSIFFVLTLLMGVVVSNPDWVTSDWTLFGGYRLASAVLPGASARFPAVARRSGFAIPAIDMPAVPAVFFLVRATLADPAGRSLVVGVTTGFYVLLVIGAMATGDAREVAVAALLATAFEVALQTEIGLSAGSAAFIMPMMALAAAGCIYVIRRVTLLVRDVADEQGRRERLTRYFSPEVAAMLATAPGGGMAGESREVTRHPAVQRSA
jgi:adenylate cyclase